MSTMNVAANPGYLAMPDATNVNLLPVGYPAYLGYTDGEFPTGKQLAIMFPEAELVLLTVTGGAVAHGVRVAPGTDVEPGNLTAEHGAVWAKAALNSSTARPVIYASVQGELGYGMPEVLLELAGLGVDRSRVRLLSAHYGAGPHICGPATCKLIDVEMDGTQWTDTWLVEDGNVDMSILKPDFFSTQPRPVEPTETERLVRELGIVRQGDTGAAVRTVQGLVNARLNYDSLTIDGIYGPETFRLVSVVQSMSKVHADGVVGPLTWPVLLGVA